MAAAAANPNSTTVTATNTASPPWSKIVRGPELEPDIEPVVDDNVTAESGGDEVKKMAWNTKAISTSNNGGGVESGAATVVMGAELWPSLSECTKISPKISSFDNSNNVHDFVSSKVTGIDISSSTSVSSPVRSPLSTSQKMTTSNSNHHSTSNHPRPSRQKSMKRDGGSNSQANGVLPHQSSQSSGEGAHYHHHNHGSPKPTTPGGSFENAGRDNVQNHSNREPGQRNSSGEHPHPHHRNPFRKGNGGPHSRGDGSHQNYTGRRSDQERGNHDLNHQRSFNGRDTSMHPRGVPRAFARPQPVPTPFVYPAPMAPFINPGIMPVLFPAGMQFAPPIPPIYFPVPGSELYPELLKQIDFYFSNENLVRDTFLRGKMDENGWVSVDVISNFNRVKTLTNDINQILEAVRSSSVVEVQGNQLRRRDDWRRWVLPPTVQFPTSSGSQSPKGPISAATDHIQSVSLDDKNNSPNNAATLQASSGDSKSASKISDEANSKGC